MINAKIVALEIMVFAVTGRVLYRTITEHDRGIPRKLLAEGHQKQLDSQYRRNVDRSVGGWVRRVRTAGEVFARSLARKKLMV